MASAPLLDREFLEKLERLTIHWQKSFAGLVGGHNISRFAGIGTGVSGPSQFPSRRRSARGQLARLPAPGKAVPEDVPGGAARAGADADRYQRFHAGARRPEVRLRAETGGGAVLRGAGAARYDRDPRLFEPSGAADLFDRRTPPFHRGDGRDCGIGAGRSPPIISA